MSKKVLSFQMHENAFLASIGGEIKKNVSPQFYKGMDMELTNHGILCHYKNARFLIPTVNCKVIELGPEEEEPKKAEKGK